MERRISTFLCFLLILVWRCPVTNYLLYMVKLWPFNTLDNIKKSDESRIFWSCPVTSNEWKERIIQWLFDGTESYSSLFVLSAYLMDNWNRTTRIDIFRLLGTVRYRIHLVRRLSIISSITVYVSDNWAEKKREWKGKKNILESFTVFYSRRWTLDYWSD